MVRANDDLHKLNQCKMVTEQKWWFVVDWKKKLNISQEHNTQNVFSVWMIVSLHKEIWIASNVKEQFIYFNTCFYTLSESLHCIFNNVISKQKIITLRLINRERFVIACIWSVSEVYYLPFVIFLIFRWESLYNNDT